ncbi:hypothetical protein HY838_01735 [Candidatus Azambacteria bacterium]|nr:hypothetical protein [Candidatus Azambacteria bacterium]
MNNDFSELIQYLDDKFSKVDDQFSKIDDQFSKIDDQFSKIDDQFSKIDDQFSKIDDQFSKIDDRFSSIDSQLEYLKENKADKSDFNNLLTAVDAYAQKADTYFQEMVMLSHKVDRHEKWLQEIADKLGVKLKY